MTGSLCLSCKHFNRKDWNAETCAAFPKEIPESIFIGGDHRQNVESDNGIKYEPMPGFEYKLKEE